MKKLNYEIDGIKYIMFSVVIRDKEMANSFCDKIQRFDGILQSFSVENSFLFGIKAKANCLIPERNAVLFSNSKN